MPHDPKRDRRFTPAVDPLEGRLALATLTTVAYRQAKVALRAAVDGPSDQAASALARAAARIPRGTSDLLQLWTLQSSTLAADQLPRPTIRRALFRSLDLYIQRAVAADRLHLRGPANLKVARPAIRALDGSTEFENLTHVPLQITVTLPRTNRILLNNRLAPGAILNAKLPPTGSPRFPGLKVSITTPTGPPNAFNIDDPRNLIFIAHDSPIPGQIEVSIFQGRL